MDAPTPQIAIREAIRHWSSLTALSGFAIQRHGYGDSDGGFGVTYPGDLDEFDSLVDGVRIPEGFVQVYGFWGPPDGYVLLVYEALYLDTLAGMLSEAGHNAEAAQVRALAELRTFEAGEGDE